MPDAIMDHHDLFTVVHNEQWQYSVWPAEKVVPEGWNRVGPTCTRELCLTFIDKRCVWKLEDSGTQMRGCKSTPWLWLWCHFPETSAISPPWECRCPIGFLPHTASGAMVGLGRRQRGLR